MTNPTPLTPNELKALAYFAVGVTSEGSLGGRDVSYRLSFAGNVGRDGLMDPVGNSGYSFGTLQVDIGQHPDVAPRLLDAYQAWAAKQPDRAALELDRGQYHATLTALQRDGHAMEDAGAHDIDRRRINRFLASDDGRSFVHQLDAQHVNGVTAVDTRLHNDDSALERLERTALYRNAGDDEQARLAAMFMKLQNQSGQRYAPRLLARVEAGELASAAEVKTAIDGLMRNPAGGGADYIESGADNTLRGTALFNTLRSASADNPVAQAWAAVAANPLVGPVAAHADARRPQLGPQFDAIRSMFLTPEASQRLVQALDRGAPLAEGDPALHNGRRRAGFFVSGGDFVHWNANGQGVACIGGQWRNVDPDHLRRTVQRDGSIDLALVENGRATPLLHVDPHARTRARPAEHATGPEHASPRPPRDAAEASGRNAGPGAQGADHSSGAGHQGACNAQAALAHLGYTGSDGRLLNVDGTLGRNSQHALAQFQRDHGLPATGHLNEATQQRLAVMERTMASNTHPANDLYRQSLSAVQALDRQMGIPGGAHTATLAGAAAAEAARAGLTRVDRVEISADRAHVQAVQFTGGVDQWATNRTSSPIDVAQAVRQPLEVSSRDAGRAMEARQSAEQHTAQERTPMRTPVL
jgi:peptidoglycan hydrolase-like protein with peptidoglycan-binding domain